MLPSILVFGFRSVLRFSCHNDARSDCIAFLKSEQPESQPWTTIGNSLRDVGQRKLVSGWYFHFARPLQKGTNWNWSSSGFNFDETFALPPPKPTITSQDDTPLDMSALLHFVSPTPSLTCHCPHGCHPSDLLTPLSDLCPPVTCHPLLNCHHPTMSALV